MTTKPVKGIRIKDGKITRVHTYDASKSRRIAKSKRQRVVSPKRAK